MPDKYDEFMDQIGYKFNNIELFLTALTHPSYAAERTQPYPDNQRLEFLGDAVLEISISDILYNKYPDFQEGKLTRLRSAISNEHSLASVATDLNMGPILRLGKGEKRSGGDSRSSNLEDVLEALIGAMYLDSDIDTVKSFCARIFADMINDPDTLLAMENPKGALQEWTQLHYQNTPVYDLLDVSGPDHEPTYSIRVLINDEEISRAEDTSRKAAEKEAARAALKTLKKNS